MIIAAESEQTATQDVIKLVASSTFSGYNASAHRALAIQACQQFKTLEVCNLATPRAQTVVVCVPVLSAESDKIAYVVKAKVRSMSKV